MSMGELLRRRREELNLTQDQVSVRAGISKPYLSTIETGRVVNPPSEPVLEKLERVLEFPAGALLDMARQLRTPAAVRQHQEAMETELDKLRGLVKQLSGGKKRPRRAAANIGEVLSAGKPIPIINRVTAGYPHDFTDLDYPPSVADEYVRCPDVHDPQAFAARVVGDSMQPNYVEGDIVIFSPNSPARSGDDCFARLAADKGTTFKRFETGRGGKLRLMPYNNKYQAQEFDRDEVTGLWPAVLRIQSVRK